MVSWSNPESPTDRMDQGTPATVTPIPAECLLRCGLFSYVKVLNMLK